jgi:hypothetical protein
MPKISALRGDHRGLIVREPDGQLEKLLHIRRVSIERGRAASREPDDEQNLPRIAHERAQRRGAGHDLLCRFKGFRLMQIASHHQRDSGEQRANEKRNAPAPLPYLLGAQENLLQEQQHEQCADLAANQGHILKARIETTVALVGHLGQIGCAGAVFAAQLKP